MAEDWNAHLEREEARYADGSERVPDEPDARQRKLTRLGNALSVAGGGLRRGSASRRRPE